LANKFPTEKDWNEVIESFNDCPHPLKNKSLRVASISPNPFIFTDFDRNIQYNEDGLPLGSHTGIVKSIGEMFGFDVLVQVYRVHHYYDTRSKTWIGMAGDVRVSSWSSSGQMFGWAGPKNSLGCL
jgi:hypothetical protein